MSGLKHISEVIKQYSTQSKNQVIIDAIIAYYLVNIILEKIN